MHEEIKEKIKFTKWLLQFRLIYRSTKNKIRRHLTLFLVVYECETGLSHVGGEQRMRVRSKIFESKMAKVTGKLKKKPYKDINRYSSPHMLP